MVAFAPDGRHFVYNTMQGLYLRDLGTLVARRIPGTEEDLSNPFFAPDGQSIAYWAVESRQLKRMALGGGAAVVITVVEENPAGAIWATDGTIFYGQLDGIYRVPANGGTAVRVIEPQDGELLSSPYLLPDGDTVLFGATKGLWADAQISAQSLSTGARTTLVQGGDPRYLPSGHLVYALGSTLFAVAFDAATLTLTGATVPLVEGLARTTFSDAAHYGIAANGSLVYLTGFGANLLRNLLWVDRAGGETAIPMEPGLYVTPRLSPAGDRVVVEERTSISSLWVWDFAREIRTRITLDGPGGQTPIWTPDGTRIAYAVPVTGRNSIDWKAANNTGLATSLVTPDTILSRSGRALPAVPTFFSPSGRELVFYTNTGGTEAFGDDIGMVTLDSDDPPVWLVGTEFVERNAELSPNGRWLAYESNESGTSQIYVRPFPNVNDNLVQVSDAGGWEPLWSRDGSELFYLEQDRRLMAVAVETDAEDFRFGNRTAVMDWPYFTGDVERPYDVSPDGQRFLVLKPVDAPDQADANTRIVIVENWVQEVEQLVGRP